MTDARRVAYQALLRIDHEGAFANLVVPAVLSASRLSERDRHFVTGLVYGTVRRRRACDHLIDRFCLRPPASEVRTLLRLGTYQLAFAGTPPHAAVDTSVELAPKGVRAFVNAVLRRVAHAPVTFPDRATTLSYPDWIVERFDTELGSADADLALSRMNEAPTVDERADGYIQDRASQWVAELVPASLNDRVADVCAAPGGKATALARRCRAVVALDVRPNRARLVVANARRLALGNVLVVVGDGREPPLRPRSFEHVLIDAPCSGLGALRRRPDARWRVTAADVDALALVQNSMIDAGAALVKSGGTLTYSVCTVTAKESIDHDRLAWPALDPPAAPWRPYGRGARLLPHDADTDGMTILRWRIP